MAPQYILRGSPQCEPQDVAGLGPRRPRRAYESEGEPQDVAGLGPRRPRRAYESEGEMRDSEAYRKGAEMRRRLLGDAFVDRSTKTVYADPVMSKFIDVATETIFGMLWTRPGLDLKTRTLVCVVSDAATGREP